MTLSLGFAMPSKLSVPWKLCQQLELMAMETWLSPSAIWFRLSIPPADAWLDAFTNGIRVSQMLVIAAPTE